MEKVEVVTKLREFSLQGLNKLREFFEDIACRIDKIEDCLPILKEAKSLLKEQLYGE